MVFYSVKLFIEMKYTLLWYAFRQTFETKKSALPEKLEWIVYTLFDPSWRLFVKCAPWEWYS